MRAVSLMVLHCLCCMIAGAHSNAAVESCGGAGHNVGAGDTINASSVRRPVSGGLNFACNETVGAKHSFKENNDDSFGDEDRDEDVVITRVKPFNDKSRPGVSPNWVSQMMSTLLPLPSDLGTACRRDTEIYLTELNNLTDWAVRMMDASAKFPHGVLMGNIRSMGDFDECLWTEPAQGIEPQYCLASVYNLDVKETHPMYEKLRQFIHSMTYGRMSMETLETTLGSLPMQRSARIEWAACIPASCSPMDVESMLKTAGHRILPESDADVRVHAKDCYTNLKSSPSKFSTRDRLILSSMLIIILLVVAGTLRDQPDDNNNQAEEKQLSTKILEAFSIKRSWKKLTDFSPSKSTRQIDCLDGLRGISSLWVVMGHQALLASSNPYSDKVTFFDTQKYTILMVLWNFFLPVDTFLVIGGLVRCYNLIPSLEKRTVNHWKSALIRYFRLTPALLVVIGIYVSLLYRISSGPLWNRQVGENQLACEWNWWKTVLYINNYFYNDREGFHLCLLQSWYTSVDMQLYLLAPLVIVPLWRNPKSGFIMLTSVAAIATIGQWATIVLYRLPGLPITVHSDDIAILTYVRTFYYVSHTRAMPYLIGIATGYVMHYYKTVTLTKRQAYVGWILASLGLLWPLFGSMGYLSVQYPLGTWRHAYFGSVHKSVWAAAISWIIFACHHGYGGSVNSFLSSRVLRFFARISYSVFVLHLGILICFAGYMRGPKHIDFPSVVKDMIGELICVIFPSILLHLFVEAPFSEVVTLVFKERKKVEKRVE